MISRLGDVLYWGFSGLAAIIVIGILWGWADNSINAAIFGVLSALAALSWLLGRACRYVLAGR